MIEKRCDDEHEEIILKNNDEKIRINEKEEKIEIHEDLRVGEINGLTYYILPNGRPKDSIELRLLIHVGSLMEADSEQGLAHFIEHLGFKGTKSYHGYELVKALQSLGITYGADLNASTHLLETNYRLSLRMDENLSQVQLGLKILKEWAFDMNISETDVHEEKNVISSEYLAKQGLGQRLLKKYWTKLFGVTDDSRASLLANRMPIGIPEVFMNAPSSQIKDFYQKWYRPENMAILIVGDFNGRVIEIEESLLQCFDEINHRIISDSNQLPLYSNILQLRSDYLKLPHHQRDVYICMQDRELTVPQFSFEFFRATVNTNSRTFIRDNIKHRLMTSLLDHRCAEIVRKEKLPNDSLHALGSNQMPFQSLGMSVRELVRGLTCIGITATIQLCEESYVEEKEETILQLNPAFETGMRLLLLEFRRLRKFGVYLKELEDAKQKWSYLFKDQRDHQTTSSSSLASDLTTHIFAGGRTVFATPYEEARLSLEIMDEITLDEMNDFLSLVLDMDIVSRESEYYSKTDGSSFRAIAAQTPQQLSLNYDSDVALELALSRARDYVQSLEIIEPWPEPDVSSEEDVIQAARVVIDWMNTNSCTNELDTNKVLEEEAKIFHLDSKAPLCPCCKMEYCTFIERPPTKKTGKEIKSDPVNCIFLDNLGAFEYTLKNGIKVCVKQMPPGSDSPGRISLQAFALGGCTELSEEEDATFSMLDSMSAFSTLFVGPNSLSALNPYIGMHYGEEDCVDVFARASNGANFQTLSGKKVSHVQSVTKTRVNTQRHLNFRGIGGSCPAEKLELLLSFLILKLSCQQIDQHAFEKTINQQRSGLAFRNNSPEFTFMERARILSCGDIPYSRPLTIDILDKVTIDMARQLYARAFMSDPTEYTFVFVGDMPPQLEVSRLLNYYLGSLKPSQVPIRQWRNASTMSSSLPFTSVGTNFTITHRQRESVNLRQDDKASSLMVFRAYTRDYDEDNEWNEEENDLRNIFALDIACRSLQSFLLDLLRIDMGKVYSVSVDWSRGSLSPLALISIGLHCHPNDLTQITSEIERCIQLHSNSGPKDDIVKGTIESLITKQKNALKCPSHWLFWILDSYKSYKVYEWKEKSDLSRSSNEWVKYFAYLRSEGKVNMLLDIMDTENLTKIYRQYFNINQSVQVLLCPEDPTNATPSDPLSSPDPGG